MWHEIQTFNWFALCILIASEQINLQMKISSEKELLKSKEGAQKENLAQYLAISIHFFTLSEKISFLTPFKPKICNQRVFHLHSKFIQILFHTFFRLILSPIIWDLISFWTPLVCYVHQNRVYKCAHYQ